MKTYLKLVFLVGVICCSGCSTTGSANYSTKPANTNTQSKMDAKTVSIIVGGAGLLIASPVAGILAGVATYTILESSE